MTRPERKAAGPQVEVIVEPGADEGAGLSLAVVKEFVTSGDCHADFVRH